MNKIPGDLDVEKSACTHIFKFNYNSSDQDNSAAW